MIKQNTEKFQSLVEIYEKIILVQKQDKNFVLVFFLILFVLMQLNIIFINFLRIIPSTHKFAFFIVLQINSLLGRFVSRPTFKLKEVFIMRLLLLAFDNQIECDQPHFKFHTDTENCWDMQEVKNIPGDCHLGVYHEKNIANNHCHSHASCENIELNCSCKKLEDNSLKCRASCTEIGEFSGSNYEPIFKEHFKQINHENMKPDDFSDVSSDSETETDKEVLRKFCQLPKKRKCAHSPAKKCYQSKTKDCTLSLKESRKYTLQQLCNKFKFDYYWISNDSSISFISLNDTRYFGKYYHLVLLFDIIKAFVEKHPLALKSCRVTDLDLT